MALVRIDGHRTAEHCLDIVRKHAIPAEHRLIGEHFTFQQDNDLKHSAQQYLNYLAAQGVAQTMVWPPQSPDFNIIEQVWDYVGRVPKRGIQPTQMRYLLY